MRLSAIAVFAAPLVGLVLASVPACHKDDGTSQNPNSPTGPSAGPAENAGEKIDEGAEKAKDKIEEGAEKTKEKAEEGAEKTKEGAKSAASAAKSAVQ